MNQSLSFTGHWAEAAITTTGFFWMAFWAFMLGYAISSIIQVFITEERMKTAMGDRSWSSVYTGTFFGFISSSCSFSALATTKSLFQKGASFVAAIAFLLASTNLVIELGIVISIFLGWQFVLGEYVGGILLILCSWLLISWIRPQALIRRARKKLDEGTESKTSDRPLTERLQSLALWARVGKHYTMEWKMVWKDVTIGFTIAGIVVAFVPRSFFEALFLGTGSGDEPGFLLLLQHVVIGPIAAFFTFIGSMGNIPLAALLFDNGVSFAGVMAFIFSDLVVLPVLRINARYYGWKMSIFILFLLFSSLVVTSLLLHYGLDWMHWLPDAPDRSITGTNHFAIDYTFWLNLAFLVISGVLLYLAWVKGKGVEHHRAMAPRSPWLERILSWLALICYLWLAGGWILHWAS